RQDPDVPLVIPEVNPEALSGSPGPRVVANPNCTTITLVMAVAPLHRAAGLRSVVVSSYQSVSGAGMRGILELAAQVEKLHGTEEHLVRPDHHALPVGEVFDRTIAFNVLPLQGAMEGDWTGEERKLMAEPRKIRGLPDLHVRAAVGRLPVLTGHAVSVYATFERPITPEVARDVLAKAPGFLLL